jgi:2-methylcitrate dehydratase PrpD
MSGIGGTRALARFAATTRHAAIPPGVTSRIPWLVLDNIAVGALGCKQPWYHIVSDVMAPLSGAPTAHVFGQSQPLDMARAALLNGVAIGGFEAGHGSWGAQPSGAVFPAALALGEQLKVSGGSLAAALAIGYEVNARIAQAQTNLAETERGFHNPSISGVFGAAAACGSLLGLDEDTLASALGLAGSHAGGLSEFVVDGAMTKRIHLGRAAQMGLESALLAAAGFTGPASVLEGRYGFLRAVSPDPKVSRLSEGLGEDWVISDMFVKSQPVHGVSLALVEGVDSWRSSKAGDTHHLTAQISRIQLHVASDAAEPRHNNPAPTTVTAAQYSVPFSVAVSLVRGTRGLIDLDESTLNDPEILRLSSVTRASHDERLRGRSQRVGGRIELEYDGGRRETVEARGLDTLTESTLRKQSLSNLARYSGGVYSGARCSRLIALSEDLWNIDDVSRLAELLPRDEQPDGS